MLEAVVIVLVVFVADGWQAAELDLLDLLFVKIPACRPVIEDEAVDVIDETVIFQDGHDELAKA
jgi:hypothetical protein